MFAKKSDLIWIREFDPIRIQFGSLILWSENPIRKKNLIWLDQIEFGFDDFNNSIRFKSNWIILSKSELNLNQIWQKKMNIIGQKRTIRPKFDQVKYRPNAGLICVKFRLFFLVQLGCQSSPIQKGYLAIIQTNLGKIQLNLDDH